MVVHVFTVDRIVNNDEVIGVVQRRLLQLPECADEDQLVVNGYKDVRQQHRQGHDEANVEQGSHLV